MNFDLSTEQQEIRATAKDLLANRGDGIWAELCELGWPGIAVDEDHGGLGLGLIELAILTEELGYACGDSPFLGSVLASLAIGRLGDSDRKARWLPGLAAGETPGALAVGGERSLIPDAAPENLLVRAEWEGKAELFERGAVEAVEAIDPRRLHARAVASSGTGEALSGDASQVLAGAAVIVAAELVGLCRRALETTRAYIVDRRQFDAPIGSFQAVQHTAAQMLRDTEAAATATYYAAWIADHESESLAPAARVAKALASDAGRSVTAAAIQLHGGIGFTWEADLHWLFKRAQIDAVYLGGGGFHRASLARSVAAAAR